MRGADGDEREVTDITLYEGLTNHYNPQHLGEGVSKKDAEKSVMNLVLVNMERQVTEILMTVIERRGGEIISSMYDGCLVFVTDVFSKVTKEDVIEEFEKETLTVFGYKWVITCDPGLSKHRPAGW